MWSRLRQFFGRQTNDDREGPLVESTIVQSPSEIIDSSDIRQRVELSVFEGNAETWSGVATTPIEIGRQQEGDSGPLDLQDLVTCQRLVVAPVSARSIPRQALRMETSDDGQLRVVNIHPRLSFYVGTQAEPLGPGEDFQAAEEIVVSLPENRTIRIAVREGDSEHQDEQRSNRRRHPFQADFESGEQLGQYVIEHPIGHGGMGTVYRARHQYMDREVAVKVPPQFPPSDRMLERFRQEVMVTARLTHANILRAYDAGLHDGHPYLVVECIRGRTVDEVVRASGILSIEETIRYSIQAARGLKHAHASDIVHRDVKPANLMIDDDDLLRVIDFGLALKCEGLIDYPHDLLERPMPDAINEFALGENSLQEANATMMVMPRSLSSTHNSHLVGTPAYMSPEQTCAVDVDRRSDIYSLGCTIFFMLTARHLFDSKSDFTGLLGPVLMRHRHQPPTPISSLRPDCSSRFEETLLRMLAKRPDDRYSSMDDVIAALTEEQKQLGFGNRVFLSYRRDDSYDATHRLYECLGEELGERSLVMDVDAIPAGEDFRDFITESVRRASAILVVIGDHWLEIKDEAGNRRLDDPDDYVRLELETAEQCEKPIIPILVGRAAMPLPDLLPESLRFLAFRNAAEVRSGKGYRSDVNNLLSRLGGILAGDS